ncbi:MAG TPA: CotH kinase family protein [Vicinamibacterales bacterium]|nr:CotH kinase family protein [Vicinamibacterales bacterium]
MPSAKTTWTLRARRAALVLAVLTCPPRLESSPPAQSNSLPVLFSPSAGTFVGSETVTLSVQGKADIHYTLDGSLPTVASPIYREAVTLDKSTRLRAVAIASGTSQGPVSTEIYLRVDPDTRSFTSHLPIILIHTFESGPLDAFGTDHVAAALQVLQPQSGTSRIVGRAALDARIGIHVRGETSRRFPKKQYAMELRADGDDTDADRPLLGLPANSDWVLSDPVVYDRALIRNALAFELSNRIGRYAPRTRFAEVFLVDDGGDVREANFLGFFTLIEKIGRAPERVNVSTLPESAAGAPAMTGGFILRIDKGVPDFSAAGRWLQFVYPDPEDMMSPERRPQLDFIRTFIDGFGQAARGADFKHPSTGQHYSEFIDVDAWIDHHILNALTKNVDGLRISAYFHKERGGRLAAGPVWDFDRSLGTPYDPRAAEPEEWQTWGGSDYFNEGWWGLLFRDPDFRSRYRARFKALVHGEFSADNLDRIVDGMVARVGDAADRNLRRWTQFGRQDDSHAAEIALLKDFLRRRVAWITVQLDTNF